MFIPAKKVLDYVEFGAELQVCSRDGSTIAFVADYERILELVIAEQVGGIVRGARLCHLQLTVAPDQLAKPKRFKERSLSDIRAQDSRTIVRDMPRTYSPDWEVCGAYGRTHRAYKTCGQGLREPRHQQLSA